METKRIREAIRRILTESETQIRVLRAKKVGIDHKEGFVIYLSDGREDYAPLQGFTLTDSQSALYGCKFIKGLLRGRIDNAKNVYSFCGIDCEEYVEVDVDSIVLADQIS